MKALFSQFEAVGLALAGYTCWVLADTSIKMAGGSALPAYEVVGLIGLAIAVLVAMFSVWRGNVGMLRPLRAGRQLLRSCLDLTNGVGVVVALRHLPLALFYIVIFFSPMVTTLMAALLLDETLEWKKVLAIVVGFLGVVVAVDPLGTARPGDWIGYVACLVCVASFSANMVWSRVMTQTETSESLILMSGLLMAAAGGACMLRHAEPVTLKLGVILAAAGLFCVMGSLCFFVALKHTSAATVSQYHYSQLVTGALIAYVVWGEKLTTSMMAGAVLIIASGLYTAARFYSSGVNL